MLRARRAGRTGTFPWPLVLRESQLVSKDLGVLVAAHSERAIRPDDVLSLYQAQGWWPERTTGQVADVLAAAPAAGAWRGDSLAGFARAVTDGLLRAYVEDMIVAPELRRAGVGRALLDCLLGQLAGIPVVTLFCQADLAPFYARCGFRATRQVVMHRLSARPTD
jgi:GNAT superfamily N-acetyltransferase